MIIDNSHPLLLDNLKAMYGTDEYMGASVVPGYGSKGVKPRPFNYHASIRSFASWAYKATMLNANAVGRIPLRLYVKKKSIGQKLYQTRPVDNHRRRHLEGAGRFVQQKVAEFRGEFEEINEPHPALRVLRNVNPWMNGFDLTVLRMIYLQLTGNAYTLVVNDPVLNIPSQLWPMPSQWVSIIPDTQRFIRGYLYGANREMEREFSPDSVIHSKRANPADLYYGMGCAQAAWTALGLHDSKRTLDQSKFDNMSRPDWLMIFKSGGKGDQLDRFEAKIQEKYRGPQKGGQFLAVGGDVSIQSLNEPIEEIGDSDRIVEEIAAAWEVPVTMLKADDPNRSSASTADTAWMRDTIQPYCLMDEEKLNEQYLPRFDVGEDAFLAYDPAVLENREFELKRRVALVAGGIATPNEVRAEEGADPLPGGDQLFPPSGASGGAAAVAGNAAVGQNQQRHNEGQGLPTGAPVNGQPSSSNQTLQVHQDSVLNGAQISAATAIVTAVAAGDLPRDAGIGQLIVLFNLTSEQAAQMMGSAGTNTPTTPNPNPRLEAEL